MDKSISVIEDKSEFPKWLDTKNGLLRNVKELKDCVLCIFPSLTVNGRKVCEALKTHL